MYLAIKRRMKLSLFFLYFISSRISEILIMFLCWQCLSFHCSRSNIFPGSVFHPWPMSAFHVCRPCTTSIHNFPTSLHRRVPSYTQVLTDRRCFMSWIRTVIWRPPRKPSRTGSPGKGSPAPTHSLNPPNLHVKTVLCLLVSYRGCFR